VIDQADRPKVPSGIKALDEMLSFLRLGDNVVWQVDQLDDYLHFARLFIRRAIDVRRKCVYMRFAPHEPVMKPSPGLHIFDLDPAPGFDRFSSEVHRIIGTQGREAFYVFDNLSALVVDWATDELLANFFQLTCPFLYNLETVAYFALTRGRHSHGAISRIKMTTQVLIDLYQAKGDTFVHPVKVRDRYSPQMFLPHIIRDGSFIPVSRSSDASAVGVSAYESPLGLNIHSIAPWESVYAKLVQLSEDGGESQEHDSGFTALKQEFSRMLIGPDPKLGGLADRFLGLRDLMNIRNRMIGSGRIGGKAVGMIISRAILLKEKGGTDFSQVLDPHDSFYIGSDVFYTFLVNNDLFRLRLQMTGKSHVSTEEFSEVERRFEAGWFTEEIMARFRYLIDYFGQAPIIVRSSSLLEDSFGNAFAGKYRSEFCASQGSPEARLDAFLKAVKLVYASTLNPDALSYRLRRGLENRDEQMAILVQRVSGMPHGKYFLPPLAGVAFSKNLYVWNSRIDPEKGIIRLVFGLGTGAVNRVGGDYPRMISVSHPTMRPEVGIKIAKYSQRNIDLLDLSENTLATIPLTDALADTNFPGLNLYVSILKGDYLEDPYTSIIGEPAGNMVLTFNNLISKTNFMKLIGEILEKLEDVYEFPVDTEFTAFPEPNGSIRINLLQCRPMKIPGAETGIAIPEKIPSRNVLFRSGRMINGGFVKNIKYILLIDPLDYSSITDVDVKKTLGRLVGRVNRLDKVIAGKIIMMGPGRWGTSDLNLGVNASYADLDNASVLVEIAREEAGHRPELSYGTHFFQDLVEDRIIYLPVFPDEKNSSFNWSFFKKAPNILNELVPRSDIFSDIVKVIDVPASAGGLFAHLIADPRIQRAVCFLGKNKTPAIKTKKSPVMRVTGVKKHAVNS